MSIFGRADADLPIITQVMQVNLNDEDEATAFLYRAGACAAANYVNKYSQESETQVEYEEEDGMIVGDDGEIYFALSSSELARMAEYDAHIRIDRYIENTILEEYAQAEGYANTKAFLIDRLKRVSTLR